MTINDLIKHAEEFVRTSPGNIISDEAAAERDYFGMRIYDSPIFAFGSADDEIYNDYKACDIIGENFMPPHEWLESANTVISFFLPYTQEVKDANSKNFDWPADEWLYARYEGQQFMVKLTQYLQSLLTDAGAANVAPALDKRFEVFEIRDASGEIVSKFYSNWSERHAAYACGLGTFGISKGLITPKGTCGRFGSVITEFDFPKTQRKYSDVYEYCSKCGMCAENCPVNSISKEAAKNDSLCSIFVDKTREICKPRYGCGKCQVKVPCMSAIPTI
jgi:epoxyqueuosine reductase QueG